MRNIGELLQHTVDFSTMRGEVGVPTLHAVKNPWTTFDFPKTYVPQLSLWYLRGIGSRTPDTHGCPNVRMLTHPISKSADQCTQVALHTCQLRLQTENRTGVSWKKSPQFKQLLFSRSAVRYKA